MTQRRKGREKWGMDDCRAAVPGLSRVIPALAETAGESANDDCRPLPRSKPPP